MNLSNNGEYEKVWQEDDATCFQDGHENVDRAYKRIVGEEFKFTEYVKHVDHGDGDSYYMKNGYLVYCSYPGNAEIWKRKEKA